MVSSSALLVAATGISLAAAAAPLEVITSILVIGADKMPLEASVSSVGPSATVFALNCPRNIDSNSCGLPPNGAVITYGSSTWAMTLTGANDNGAVETHPANCNLDPAKDVAVCTAPGTDKAVTTETVSSYKTYLQDVTITAGLTKLAGATNSGSAPSKTAAASGSDASSKSDAAKTGSSSTSSGAGAPIMTQNAVLAGAAAVLGALAL